MSDAKREGELSDWMQVLGTDFGRRVIGRIIARCRVFASVVQDPETGQMDVAEKVYYSAGKQDIGHWVMGEAIAAHPQACQQMEFEALERRVMEERANG